MAVTEARTDRREARAPRVNDFTFQAATVNGSGSQSSNLILTRAVFSMGIPVAPKNVFPSNIEGLPTWYNIRLTPEGYQCGSRSVDVLVALNATTWHRDVAGLSTGAAVIHEAAYPVTGPARRDDVVYYPVPFHELGRKHIQNADLRKYLTNMIYVGAVAWLLDIPMEVIEAAVQHQFARKPKAVPLNMDSIRLGYDHCVENHERQDLFRVERLTGKVEGKILMEGNQAAALGALMGGCTVASWYPITPSSSLCEYLNDFADRYRVDAATGERRIAVIQAEDELAAVGMALGAGWAGARSMTSTSGPGISLMAEFVGLGYYAEIPTVIVDVQRVGPSTGLPTRTMQGDVGFAATLSHGDTRHVLLLPGSVAEAYEFMQAAFDLAERLQTPVFVLTDLDLGMNLWISDPLAYPERPFDRGKVLTRDDLARLGRWSRYRDVDGDAIPWRTLPGTDHQLAGYFTRGSGHDEDARYTELPEVYQRVMDRLAAKYETARQHVPSPLVEVNGATPVAIVDYGTTMHATMEARDALLARGLMTNHMRVRAIPFTPEARDFVRGHERVYVVEQNRDGQLLDLLRLELADEPELLGRLRSIRHYDGTPIDAASIYEPVLVAEGLAAPSEFERPSAFVGLAVEAGNT
ncbi:MAG: 2-oxoacid:acceptor oxidoreductase subunit alpha [Candidatus Dormibacteria bacterium]